jgi:hypothetical protein
VGTVFPGDKKRTGDTGLQAGIGPDGERLIFLLGLPRSGTTLLSALLGNHPAISAPAEPWLMLALHQLGHVPLRHPANAQVLGTAVRRFAEGATTDGTGMTAAARAAARVLYDGWLRREGRTHILDKTPRYHLILDYLVDVFPKARFVWLLRDPLDVAASHLSSWGQDIARMIAEERDDPAVFDLLPGLDALERFHARYPSRIHLVRYEDLATAPNGPLQDLLDQLGLPADSEIVERMTDLAGFIRPDTAFGDSKIFSTRSPHNRSIGSWRTVLDETQRRILLDAIGTDRLSRLGYGATVAALAADGICGQGPELTAHHQAQARQRLEARWSDLNRIATFGAALPDDVQARDALAIDRLTSLLTAATNRHTELERRLEERACEAAALRASTSWRITAPLRTLALWARRRSRTPAA